MTKHLDHLMLALFAPTLTLTLAAPAHAQADPPPPPLAQSDAALEAPRARPFEVALSSETTWHLQSSAAVTSEPTAAGAAGIRVGWSPLELVDVFIGWKSLGPLERDDRAWELATGGDVALVGARARYRLTSWFALTGALDLEALHADVELEVESRRASVGGWTFGAVPRVGLEAGVDLGFMGIVARVEGGYAWRAPLAVDDVRLSSDAESVVPIDLGTLDLSGPVLSATLALRF